MRVPNGYTALTSETVSGQGLVANETFVASVLSGYAQPCIRCATVSAVVAVVAVEHDAKGERDFQQAGRGVVDLAP